MASASTRDDLPGALDEDVRPIQREPGLPESNPDLEEGDWRGKGETDTGLTTLRDDTSLPTPAVKAITLSEDDPEHPRNWSTAKKMVVNLVLCAHVLPLTYSSTSWGGSMVALERHFGMSQEVAILGVSLNVMGFAAGPLVWGPSSELLGRRLVYIISGVCFTATAFGVAFATNVPGILILRFFVGFFGASSINNVPASISDYTTLAQRVPYTAFYAFCAFVGAAWGPLCSNFIERYAGFRWNLRVMAIFAGVMTVAVTFCPETHGPTLLKRRIKKAGNAPPSLTAQEVVTIYKVALARPILYLLTEPMVSVVCIYLSLLYGIFYAFFQAFGVVYLEIRGMTPTSYGLTYISVSFGFLISSILLATVANSSYLKMAREAAERGEPTPPEARLTLAYPCAIIAPLSLFLFAWTAPYRSVHWVVPCLAEVIFNCAMQSIFMSLIPLLVDIYTITAASALAAAMASRALIAGIFPLFSLQMYHKLGVQGATCLLAGLLCVMAPVPFVFGRIGPRLRSKSKHV